MNENNSDNGLDVLLIEYKSLRDEIKMAIDHQIKIFAIIISALGIIYSIIFINNEANFLIFLIPIFLFPLGLRGQYSNYGLNIMGEYLRLLEEQIKTYTPKNLFWDGWQHYWNERKSRANILFYDAFAKGLLYLGIPIGIAIIKIYCEGLNVECFGLIVNKGDWFFCFNLLLIIFALFILLRGLFKNLDNKKYKKMEVEILNKIESLRNNYKKKNQI